MALFGLFGSKETIETLVNDLPEGGLTVRTLRLLDYLAPGEWSNPTSFDEIARTVTGETDPDFLASIKTRALSLYADKSEGYRKAIAIYQRLDSTDKALAAVAAADKVGEKISLLRFLDKLTPASDTTQTVDLALKLVGELLAFRRVNGIPGDGIADFVDALGEYAGEAKIRMTALVAFDGLVPLGPDFLTKSADAIDNLSENGLRQHAAFGRLVEFMPGGDRVSFVRRAFGAASEWIDGFVSGAGLDREGVVNRLREIVEVADDKLDYLAAFLDFATRPYAHTGTQSVASRLLERAANEV